MLLYPIAGNVDGRMVAGIRHILSHLILEKKIWRRQTIYTFYNCTSANVHRKPTYIVL